MSRHIEAKYKIEVCLWKSMSGSRKRNLYLYSDKTIFVNSDFFLHLVYTVWPIFKYFPNSVCITKCYFSVLFS